MTVRTKSPTNIWVVALVVLSSTGCVLEPGGRETDQNQGEGANPVGIISAPTCFAEEPGCGCAVDTPSVTCARTEERGDVVLCERGAMYCVDGVWSECDTVENWEVPRPKLITNPSACSPCNPDCFQTNDEPSQVDIDTPPSGISSVNVEYTLGPPRGIRPTPVLIGGMPGADTDMDGVPDGADDCPMTPGDTAYFGCTSGVGTGGFFHVLPPGATGTDPLTFDVALTEADVYLLVDTTGSMGDEIANLRSGLTTGVLDPDCPTLTGVIGAIRCTISGTWFGVGSFEDYPVSPYGSSSNNDLPFRNLLDLTANTAAAQTAVNGLTLRNGNDIPESNSQALYAIASGNGLSYNGTQYLAARTGCPAGHWGYPCFRPNVIPIVIMITDAAMHNGPGGRTYAGTYTNAVNIGWQENNNNTVNIGSVNGSYRVYTGSTGNADNNKNGGDCTSSGSKDRRFLFTVTTTTTVTIDTRGSSYDTVVYLYSGNSVSDSNELACNDDDIGTTSRIVRTLTPGTYTVRLDGYDGNHGNFQIGIGEAVEIPGGVPYPDVISAMNARNVRFIGVNSLSAAYSDLNAVAAATSSLDGDGNPFIETVGSNGSGLSTAIVDAVVDLANFSRMDVDVQVENVMLLPGIPASALVQSITLGAPGCAGGCTGPIPNGCAQCLPGTDLPFSVTFANNVIAPGLVDQIFNFDLIVRGNLGAIELQRVPVRIVVPAGMPSTNFMSGSFSRTFRASPTCMIPPTRPDWGLFNWEVSTPGSSNVVFQFRTAETEDELNDMSPVTFSVPAGPDVPTTAEYLDVGALITAAGGRNYLPFLRVTAVLNPSPDGLEAPTLTTMGLQFGCVDSE